MTTPLVRASLFAALAIAGISATRSDELPLVQANDNRIAAGILANDTLKLSLVVSMARWYPEAPDGPHIDVAAFSEEGKAPSIPAPLIRVPEGTTIAATVRNTFTDSTLYLRGFVKHPSAKFDSVAIKPGETRTFTFPAGAPGTYLYYATLGTVNYGVREREQLAGAFVVDPPGAQVNDRILMINIWGEELGPTVYDNAVAINGKSWPYTERIHTNVGDSLHWRVINGSIRPHPMHLHGFYFRIDSRGHFAADSAFPVDKRHLEVTEEMRPGATMVITWSPDRPGNWLFHCHFIFHVNEGARLGFRASKDDMHDMMHEADPMKHMAGLVMGINVSDTAHAYQSPFGKSTPGLRLYADERRTGGGYAMSYVLQRGARPPAVDSVEKGGQPIVLTQHEPVQITVVNRTHAATSVHWHGIELESYNDGVAGWSGAATTTAPMIAPNDSFVARLLLPRSGTFIYHTHLNDVEQITSGAYGPIIVLQPGQKFDPETDHVFTLGWHGTKPQIYLNGDSVPPPVRMRYGKLQRLRFVNIGAAGAFVFTLKQDSTTVTWRPAAKDGAALPADEQVIGPSIRRLTTGETFDAEWMPKRRGSYVIAVRPGGAKNSGVPAVTQRIIVR